MTRTDSPPSAVRALMLAGSLLLAEAAVIGGVLAASGRDLLLPVTISVTGGSGDGAATGVPDAFQVILATVDTGVAVIAVCALSGALAVLAALRRPITEGGRGLHTARWTAFALLSSVVVFLVARLNGIGDVGSLVPIFALTSSFALFAIVQERVVVLSGHPRLALCFGAAVGIVPWGVIAFHQIGAGILGGGAGIWVRVLTLTMLGWMLGVFLFAWREQRAGSPPRSGTPASQKVESAFVWLVFAGITAFAWLVVAGIVL